MKRYLWLMTLMAPLGAFAQIQVSIALPLPTIQFQVAPALVTVSPGIQVVPDQDDEIFFYNGYYWTRREDHWWRMRGWHGAWAPVRRGVPVRLARIPPGQYRRWHGREEAEERHEMREERRQDREERHEERHREGHVRGVRGGGPPPWAHGGRDRH